MTQLDAFLLSIVVEAPIATALAVRLDGTAHARRVALVGIMATCVTHPFVWRYATTWSATFALELLAWLVEAICYSVAAGLRPRVAVVVSGAANASSFGAGLALVAALHCARAVLQAP